MAPKHLCKEKRRSLGSINNKKCRQLTADKLSRKLLVIKRDFELHSQNPRHLCMQYQLSQQLRCSWEMLTKARLYNNNTAVLYAVKSSQYGFMSGNMPMHPFTVIHQKLPHVFVQSDSCSYPDKYGMGYYQEGGLKQPWEVNPNFKESRKRKYSEIN